MSRSCFPTGPKWGLFFFAAVPPPLAGTSASIYHPDYYFLQSMCSGRGSLA